MHFNDFFINTEDWKFFESLPFDEQILFVHDLICEEYYGKGSTDEVEKENIKLHNFIEFLERITDKLYDNDHGFSVLFLDKYIVFNSESKELLYNIVATYFEKGYILSKVNMSKQVTMLLHKMRYCEMYRILGIENKISMN
jgi:hypothetical protein